MDESTVSGCFTAARPGQPHCFPDSSGTVDVPWLAPGDTYYWWDFPSGTLEIAGHRFPLTTRWILCPVHAAQAAPLITA